MRNQLISATVVLLTLTVAINATNAVGGLMTSSSPTAVTAKTGLMTSSSGVQSTVSSSTSSSSWNLYPSSGPQAGGTFVTLTGSSQQLSDCSGNGKVFVLFGPDQVKATFINSQSVVASSPISGYIGDRQVWVTCNNTIINTNRTFTFRPNPTIGNLSPLATILAGGIGQTVIGRNLDSATINLITSDFGQKTQTRLPCQPCQGVSKLNESTCIVCPTTGSFNTNNSRISPSSSSSFLGILNATLVWDAWRYTFPLSVFLNPLVQQLVPEPQDFVVNHDRRIQLQVSWPAFNLSVSDVTVRLLTTKTNVVCGDVVVTSSGLSCRPPSVSVQLARYAAPEDRTALVQVNLGNDVTSAGHVIYVLEEPFNVVMIVMIALIVFVTILSFVYGCLALFHAQLEACCPLCCTTDDTKLLFVDDATSLNGSQPPYQPFGDDTASQGHRGQKKASKKQRDDRGIEMIDSVKRIEV